MRGLILAALLAGLVAVPALADPAAAAKTTVDEPQTFALANVDVVTGSKARLPYRIQDAAAPSAVATVVITTPDGVVVVEAQLPDSVATGARLVYVFTCDLAPGTYQYHVDVVDSLGRPQIAARAARLRVLAIFPQAASIRRASLWLSRRQSYVGFAVIDDRGELRGYHLDRRFASASVVKAMLLVEYLRAHPTIGARMRTTLERMIIVSDNTAASAIFKVVGGTGLNVCARLAGMTHFSVGRDWWMAQITAADQARLFFSMDAFVPAQYRTWVRYLFSHITSVHCWGIPQVARPAGWQDFFKGGYMPVGGGIAVHEASRLEHRGVVFSLVVLTS
ncbi:MAG TPA: serine hydrolase, partial [Thermoleophilia bacterium]